MTRRALFLAVLLPLAGLFDGCSVFTGTVVPPPVEAKDIAWSGNEQNAGVLDVTDKGVLVNEDFRSRYDLAISIYQKRLTIPMEMDQGLSLVAPGQYLLLKQYFPPWALMNSWRRADLAKFAKKTP